MARTLFFRMVFGKFSEITKNKLMLIVSTIFFTIMNISFFSLRLDLFSITAKEVNQICSVCCSSPFLVLLCTRYDTLQCFST